ncbi:hydroxyisourate hydrolase [Cereibacter sphaeroides]|uniref:hydroxyisourate hydrolase n=1 Tax=Cereibacter sphaeroides TaxID=1063 RepID=UPI001F2317FF|nr:hydroxyisourate hydrolase [Cereibacter sphaeroides]MCE6958950.1 hydroxyisourate hydrolase [Cereibacter sphaeroides]MCE6968819.1 hydroxyisourate hydrolase [Cereibacter sphaeroides]MCE6971183.1 hydroxyisourate hydrolase [Cereibacter sphaeroides]
MGRLTTHVLDTARGRPAEGIGITLTREGRRLAETVTNADGRTNAPLLSGVLEPGSYELLFSAGAYLRASGQVSDGVPFLDEIPIRFGIAEPDAHYHVPLLLSPFGYSTYRGS